MSTTPQQPANAPQGAAYAGALPTTHSWLRIGV